MMNDCKIKISSGLFVFCFLVAVMAFSGIGCGSEETHEAENESDIVAIVNKEEITRGDLRNEIKFSKRKYRIQKSDVLPPQQWILLKTNSLNELIKQAMLLQEAKLQGVKSTEQETMTFLERSLEGYDKENFRRSLEIEEISQDMWNQKQENLLIIQKLTETVLNSEIQVSEEDVQNYYHRNKEEFQKGEQVHALHIMVETEDEARRILKLIRKGESFSDLAKENSLAPEGKTGGDMGFFEAGTMPKGFDDVFKLDIGKVSDIIRTPFGYHIFKVEEKKPARNMNFEESKNQIQKSLLQERQELVFQKWVETIKEKSEIIIYYEVLETI